MKKTLFAILLLSIGNLHAQNTVDLNPITITSTRTPQKLSETGRNITVVDGKMFNQLPVNSLDELLKYVPGVEIQSRGPMGAQSDIIIRGGTFQQVLVLIDGIKINDPITGHFSSNIPIAPTEIERIEVLRGPASAIYGAEAVGGVINIITKTFNKFSADNTTTTEVGVAAGEYRFIKANAGIQKTSKKINAALGILSNNTSGQLLRGQNRGYNYNHTLSGSVAVALKNNWTLALRSGYDNRDFAAQNFYTPFKSDTATEKVTGWWNQLNIKHQTEKSTQQIDVVYKKTTDYFKFNPRAVANENNSNYFVFQYLHSVKFTKNIATVFGGIFDQRSIASNDRGNHQTNHGAIFSSMVYAIENVKVAPSLRLDIDENYGAALLPQLNISYQIKNVTLRANAGRAIRSGDFTERYNNYNKALVTSGNIGNPNLSTENSWSYETGADAFIGKNLKISISGFYRDQNNVIDWVPTAYADMPRKDNLSPSGRDYALAKNVKKLKTSGIELDLAFQKELTNNQYIVISSGITFLDSKSSDAVPSFYILSHANSMFQTNIIYSINQFSVSGNLIYKNRKPLNAADIEASITRDYILFNGRIAYTLAKKAELFVATNNISNIMYSDLLGSLMPRRWTTAGVNVKF